MTKLIAKFVAWFKTSKWAFLAVMATIATIVILVFRGLFMGDLKVQAGSSAIPAAPAVLEQAVAAAHEAALVARVKSSTDQAQHMAALATIATDPDGVARRQKLAALLSSVQS